MMDNIIDQVITVSGKMYEKGFEDRMTSNLHRDAVWTVISPGYHVEMQDRCWQALFFISQRS